MNHSSWPHRGQVASPVTTDGSTITFAKQSGHVVGSPSGVRDEIVIPAMVVFDPTNA